VRYSADLDDGRHAGFATARGIRLFGRQASPAVVESLVLPLDLAWPRGCVHTGLGPHMRLDSPGVQGPRESGTTAPEEEEDDEDLTNDLTERGEVCSGNPSELLSHEPARTGHPRRHRNPGCDSAWWRHRHRYATEREPAARVNRPDKQRGQQNVVHDPPTDEELSREKPKKYAATAANAPAGRNNTQRRKRPKPGPRAAMVSVFGPENRQRGIGWMTPYMFTCGQASEQACHVWTWRARSRRPFGASVIRQGLLRAKWRGSSA
jgi:hypothetical protein